MNDQMLELKPNESGPRVAVYARVSSEEQTERQTIKNQIEFAKGHAQLANAHIVDFYLDDGVSGIIPLDERPEGSRLLLDAREGRFQQVWFYRLDRLGRKALVIFTANEQLQKAGVTARSLTEPFDTSNPFGEFVLGILAMVAGYERAAIIERTSLGRRRTAREGRWPGGQSPLGYRVAGGKLVIDDDEAEWVRMIFRLCLHEGLGTEAIASRLNSMGVPTAYVRRGVRRGRVDGQWRGSLIAQILHNKTYAGTFRWSKRHKVVEFEVPSIVPREVSEEAQARLQSNLALASRGAKHDYLLRSLIRCGSCGNTFVGHFFKRSKYEYKYYVCIGKRKDRALIPCRSLMIRADALEGAVWQDVENFVSNPGEVVEALRQEIARNKSPAAEQEIGRLNRLLAVKGEERARMISFLRRGLISNDEAESELAEVSREETILRSRRDDLLMARKEHDDQQGRLLTAEALLKTLQERLDNADFRTRQEVVRTLVREIKMLDGEARITYAFQPASIVSSTSVVPEHDVEDHGVVGRVKVVAVAAEV